MLHVFDHKGSYGHRMQNMSRLIQPMGALIAEHIKNFVEYPSVHGGKRFDVRAGNHVNTQSGDA
jgi:hypothetical protein